MPMSDSLAVAAVLRLPLPTLSPGPRHIHPHFARTLESPHLAPVPPATCRSSSRFLPRPRTPTAVRFDSGPPNSARPRGIDSAIVSRRQDQFPPRRWPFPARGVRGCHHSSLNRSIAPPLRDRTAAVLPSLQQPPGLVPCPRAIAVSNSSLRLCPEQPSLRPRVARPRAARFLAVQ